MIARIFIPILFAIVLPDLYFDQHYWRNRYHGRWWLRLLWWLPGLVMLVYTIALVSIRDFAPGDLSWLNVYMFLVGLIVWPKAIFALCSGLGLLWSRWRHHRVNFGNVVAVVLILINWYMLVYGSTIGPSQLEIQRNDLYFSDLPPRFDGYRIVFFSDAHVGSFTGRRRSLLQRDIDSINAQHADLIAFGGDLQNIRPQEIPPVMPLLSQLRARDGVVSVLGNHDYSEYTRDNPQVEAANRRRVVALQRQMGWRLLLNSHFSLHRGTDSLVVAGEQNFRKPDSCDFSRTMRGVGEQAFVVMLQHDPRAWDDHIVPSHRVALTLSGHTHGGQIALFGVSPVRLVYAEDAGLYERDGSTLCVSAGIGGLVFFRFGVPPEINVITLHRIKHSPIDRNPNLTR